MYPLLRSCGRCLPQVHVCVYRPVLAALWLLLGVLTVALPTLQDVAWYFIVPVSIIAVFFLWSVSHPRDRFLSVFFGAGLVLATLHVWAPRRTYVRVLPRAECRASIRGVVLSHGYYGDDLPWLTDRGKVSVRLSAVRAGGSEEWHPCYGKVLMRSARAGELVYGRNIEADGCFRLVRKTPLPGSFDYRLYLRSRGIVHEFVADAVMSGDCVHGWRRVASILYALRTRAVDCLIRRLGNESSARIAAAMTLGFREGLDRETRQRFIRSGAVHVFAISGLHVGIVSVALLTVLKCSRVPYRWRYVLLPVVLALYVMATGGAPSALRAWIMIAVWSFAKALLRPVTPVNAIGLAALLLLTINPLNVFRPGFQFSFIIVSVLVLGWDVVSGAIGAVHEKGQWVPLRNRHPHGWTLHWVHRRALQLVSASMLAWLGSAGLVAWSNSLFIPIATVVNVGVSLLAWLGLCAAGFKLFFGLLGFGWLDGMMAFVLNGFLQAIRGVVELGVLPGASLAIPQPPRCIVLLYYGFLTVLLLPRLPHRWRLASGIGVCALLFVMAAGVAHHREPQVTVLCGDGSRNPVVVLQNMRRGVPIVFHPGNRRLAWQTADWLKMNGDRWLGIAATPESGDWARDTQACYVRTGGAETLYFPSAGEVSTVSSMCTGSPRHRTFVAREWGMFCGSREAGVAQWRLSHSTLTTISSRSRMGNVWVYIDSGATGMTAVRVVCGGRQRAHLRFPRCMGTVIANVGLSSGKVRFWGDTGGVQLVGLASGKEKGSHRLF
ncbi:MAG: competence protein ComEC family protein [Candidatus Pacebacteria bacterium]|nr:competence protein ComEC family protein [Candidatus Paceibacterota bacterium]